jgi:drug/metabolite transporter (DMT)-like permease
VLLDESPSAVQLSGVAIVLAGVAFATLEPERMRPWRTTSEPAGSRRTSSTE